MVDIDEVMTNLAKTNHLLTDINQRSLHDPRVSIVNQDAFQFAFSTKDKYDVVLIDLVDPSNEKLAKLYSEQLYRQIGNILTERGVMVTQATSSFFSPHCFLYGGKHRQIISSRAICDGVFLSMCRHLASGVS